MEEIALQYFTDKHLDNLTQLSVVKNQHLREMKIVASILPFRVNNYVLDNLIDWENVPNDPIYQLVFPQKAMLSQSCYDSASEIFDNKGMGIAE